MTQTTIEWVKEGDHSRVGHTVNPIRAYDKRLGLEKSRKQNRIGHFCERCDPGCAHCYAARYQPRRHMYDFVPENRKRVGIFLDDAKLREVFARGVPTAYFWCDMTDAFGEWVTDDMLDAITATQAATSRHLHMMLTKRARRMREYYTALGKMKPVDRAVRLMRALPIKLRDRVTDTDAMGRWPIERLRVGVSISNQPGADERLPELARTPAWDRYVSYEPALGPVTIRLAFCTCTDKVAALKGGHSADCILAKRTVDQLITRIIIGGETGPGARWNYIGWTKSLIRQGEELHVAIFNKQLGSRPTFTPVGTKDFQENPIKPVRLILQSYKGNDPTEWPVTAPDGRGGQQPINLKVRQWPA